MLNTNSPNSTSFTSYPQPMQQIYTRIANHNSGPMNNICNSDSPNTNYSNAHNYKILTTFPAQLSQKFQIISNPFTIANMFPQTNTKSLTRPMTHSMISLPISTVNDLFKRIEIYESFITQLFTNNPSLNINSFKPQSMPHSHTINAVGNAFSDDSPNNINTNNNNTNNNNIINHKTDENIRQIIEHNANIASNQTESVRVTESSKICNKYKVA